ncbi:MAG: phospholipid carrier-dependent glycosyltransferase [Chloroflexota bacterium]
MQRNNVKGTPFLWIFAFLFVTLGVGYSTITPIFENSDETLHYPYIKHLADGKGLPLAIPDQLWNQEGTQHPLYYAIVAASTFWIDSDNLLEHLQPNPHWQFTEVRTLINDNQNLVLHGPMDNFPYRQAALAIHIGRWWSLLFGLITVICTFLITRYLFPNNLPLLLTTTALTALNPQFIRVSATVSNDSLSAALTSLTILATLVLTDDQRFVQSHKSNANSPWKAPLLLSILCGLALLTKLSSVTTIFVVGFIIVWRFYLVTQLHEKQWQLMTQWLGIIGLMTLIFSGWWFFRNYQLYGEWLATETHLNLAGRGDLALSEVWQIRAEAQRAYWGTFGWGQIRPPEWVYQLIFWFTRIGVWGLGLACLAKLVQGERLRPLPVNTETIQLEKIVFLSLWATLNIILYIRWVMSVGSVSHTRLIFPALTAVSLLLAIGWQAILPKRLTIWLSGFVTISLLLFNLYALGWLIYPAFTPNKQVEANPQPWKTVNLTYLDKMRLTKTQVYPQSTVENVQKPDRQVKQGAVVLVDTEWQVLDKMDTNYSVAVSLISPDGVVLSQRETFPGLGLRPTRYLDMNDTFQDRYPLQVKEAVATPMVAQVVATLFDVESEARAGVDAIDEAGEIVTPILGQIKIVPDPWPTYQPQQSATVIFGETISLIGYDLSTESEPTLTLYWQALASGKEDYTLFIHLLDSNGEVVAQADRPPTNNFYPTSWWSSGDIIADTHPLPVTDDTVALRFGLYATERLKITESTLPTQDQAIELIYP